MDPFAFHSVTVVAWGVENVIRIRQKDISQVSSTATVVKTRKGPRSGEISKPLEADELRGTHLISALDSSSSPGTTRDSG